MLKKDVIKYLGYKGATGDIAKLLRISGAAVCLWGELVPRKRAERLHEIFRTKKFTRKHPLTDDTPAYDSDAYDQAVIDNKSKVARHKYRELRDKYGEEDDIGHKAAQALNKSDRARTESKKLEILTAFTKGLI